MRNRNEAPDTILANTEVFDYLKEKVGERKTRTEAYCDLLDKSLAGLLSTPVSTIKRGQSANESRMKFIILKSILGLTALF